MRERPAKLPASLHHSSSSCHVNVTNVTNAINTTSSSLARVRKEEAKRASLLGISSLEENDTGSLLEESEGSLLEDAWVFLFEDSHETFDGTGNKTMKLMR